MIDDKRLKLLDSLDVSLAEAAPAAVFKDGTTDINNELVRERRLKNDDAEQNIHLKRTVLKILFWFLGVETFFVFLFAFFQAIKWPFLFQLQEWSFNILITATIIQIASMLLVAVRYLFPTGNSKNNGGEGNGSSGN